MLVRRFVGIWSLALVGACSAQLQAPPLDQPAPSAQSTEQRLFELVEAYWEEYLRLNPLNATLNGDNRYNDRLENSIGPRYLAESLALEEQYLRKLQSIDAAQLSGQARLTYDIFKLDRDLGIQGYRFPGELLPINQSFSLPALFAQMGAGGGLHPFATVKDYEDWLKRVNDFISWVDQGIVNMRAGMTRGIVQPRIVMEKVLPQLESMVVADPTQSLFYRPVAQFPQGFSQTERARLTAAFTTAIREQIMPAYRRLHAFIRDEYLPRTRATVGIDSLPEGEEWYAYLVKLQTTTALTPEQIHALGLKEVARIRAEMQKVIEQVRFSGDLPAFFAHLRSDPRFYYAAGDDLLNGYRALKDRVQRAAPRLFAIAPKADFEIRAVEEFRARSAAGASYMPATPDGARPGVFYVNTYDLKSRPRYSMQSIYLHEAVPGHHFQLSIQQELENLPRFRRFGGYTAYIEGWGLYSESLGRELGLYSDPYDYFGALGAEIFRAVRLVVDTGIHAKGWAREQAIEYLSANAPVGPADAVSEIERYIAFPGQALAYKVGELKLKELRARAAERLGQDFDVREFHSEVLTDGALPLDVLEAKVDRWIRERTAASTHASNDAFRTSVVAQFDEPWAMTFLPDGRLLVTEKKGALRLHAIGGRTGTVRGVPQVAYAGQGGLGDIVLHPNFVQNRLVYLSYAEAGNGNTRGAAVARAKLTLDQDGGGELSDVRVIWRQVPRLSGAGHYGHRLVFGPSGHLWISSGERQHFDPAQDLQANLGKVLRLHDDGSAPADNPFADQGGVSAQIWSLGHRNPLGLAFDAHGRLWEVEMGPSGGDELNLISRGTNYGYPLVSNGDHYDGRAIPDHDTRPEFKAPVLWWTPVISPSSLMIYSGSEFPQWRGDGFIGGLSSKSLVRLEFDGEQAREAQRFSMDQEIREVEQGPDGAIWLLENGRPGSGGRLLKLTAAG